MIVMARSAGELTGTLPNSRKLPPVGVRRLYQREWNDTPLQDRHFSQLLGAGKVEEEHAPSVDVRGFEEAHGRVRWVE